LEDEINTAYSNPALPNAVLLLSRKLIENLVYNLLENRFSGIQTDLYYNTGQMRAHDFSVLLDNLKKHKSDLASDQQESIERFLKIMDETKFRREANSATHKVMEYLDSMREIQKFKIPHMAQILLHLIDQLREPEPKFLNVIKAEQLDNGLLISLMNAGNEPVTLTDYAVEGLPKQPFGRMLVIQKGETKRFALETPEGFRFQKGKSVQFRLWLEGGRELPFQHAVRIR